MSLTEIPAEPHATARPSASLDPAAFARLERSFRGELVRPASASYDEHRRVWNGSIDRYPALIARCAVVEDVVAAVAFGRETGLPVAVRGGGHSFPGLSVCDDGIVIDLGLMKRIALDPDAGSVRVEGGVLLGELDRATQEHGMAVPIGAVTHTGVAGLTLGGGIGWLMRKHGLSIDQLVSVRVVTAAGEVVTAGATENPDLFWGVRGGGGNFGIVTEFEFRLNPVGPMVLAGLLLWSLQDADEVVRFYRDWCADAPDELMTALILRRAPAVDFVPRELHGRPVIGVVACWAGPLDRGEAVVAPMRTFGRPLLDLCRPRPFVEQQAMLDPSFPPGIWAYIRACNVDRLTDEVLDVALDHAGRIVSPRTSVTIWQLGGAVGRVGESETAFAGRSSGHVFNISGATDSADGFEAERAWARALGSALAPHSEGAYVNFLMEEGDARVREVYGAERFERLTALKRKYDPDNFFRLNQNIQPT